MSEMTICNYCQMKDRMKEAKKLGCKIVMRPSSFMGGINVWRIPNGEELKPQSEMIEPCDKYPNGNEAYDKYHVAWLGGLTNSCVC